MQSSTDLTTLRDGGIAVVDFKERQSNIGDIYKNLSEPLRIISQNSVPVNERSALKNKNATTKKLIKEMSQAVGIKKHILPDNKQLQPWAWHNGELVNSKRLGISPMSQGFLYGAQIFEGIRAFYDEATDSFHLVGLKPHLERLEAGCKFSKMDCPSVEKMTKAIEAMLKANGAKQDCYVRPFVYTRYQDLGPMFVDKGRTEKDYAFGAIQITLGDYLPKAGVHALITPFKKIPSESIPAGVKYAGSYVSSCLAKGYAKDQKFDFDPETKQYNGFKEAIMMNYPKNGEEPTVAEASSANLFIIKRDGDKIILKTTRAKDNILVGITRAMVMEIAKALSSKGLNFEVIEGEITQSELLAADEAFFTGTAAMLIPLKSVSTEPTKGKFETTNIGTGKRGPITYRLQNLYESIARAQAVQNPTEN